MKERKKIINVVLPTLNFLNNKGTTKTVTKEYNKLRKNIKDIDDENIDSEKTPIYFMYYILYKVPSLIDKLETYRESFVDEVIFYARELYPSFIEIYLETFSNKGRSFTEKYNASVERLFKEDKDVKKVKKVFGDKISNAIRVYFLNGNILNLENIKFEVSEEMIENYVYHSIIQEINTINFADRYRYIYKVKKMNLDELVEYVERHIEGVKKINVSNDIFANLVEEEKAILRYISLMVDEQILTFSQNSRVKK